MAARNRSKVEDMRRFLAIILLAGFLIGLMLAPDAWGQGAAPEPLCAPDQDCAEIVRWGGWGLIILGLLFFVVWLEPRRRSAEGEQTTLTRIPMLQAFQRRIDKELAGWRRFQWPVLGALFIALGAATLAGWR